MFIRFVVLCTFLACNFRRTTGTEVEMVYLSEQRAGRGAGTMARSG
jgi:hypothetical protein